MSEPAAIQAAVEAERNACAAAMCPFCEKGVQRERDHRGRWYHVGDFVSGPVSEPMKYDCKAGPILERGWTER